MSCLPLPGQALLVAHCPLMIILPLFPGGLDHREPACNSESYVQSLGQEDLLEKGKATLYSILAWKIPWTKEPGRLQSLGSQNQT